MKPFDFKSCRSKLEDHYKKTATVPTSVWSKKAVVDIHQIYTRLSWVKEEQTPAGPTQSELKHYTELFTADKNGVIPKRILVQGQTGIGKSTFVKKLLVDWVEVNRGAGVEQTAVLRNFELVVAVNLKEVSKCERLTDIIRLSNVFAKEDKYMTEGLMNYITNNQEKVLLIFDGYDEYRSGCDSEIYEIFRGNSLRSCCVLITSRISKADELRGGEDLHAEITGFSKVDGQKFMRRFLTHDEVFLLEGEIYKRKLNELAEVPLLLLFFCLLWKKAQSKHFPETKAKLYLDIIQFILNHSYRKQSPPQYVEVTSFKEILSEIGKVALQALLKDDHLFEYSQLSDSVRCDESVFIGLLQITEFSENFRPVGMVSFIHKSIQEFLAAWYVTYRCIPEEGNLGEISVKLEECLALENVFQFICGLSEDGALAALRHFKSVRISDPWLDLSKAVPDLENETDRPLSDVTERQWKFSCLVFDSFKQIESKAELSRACFDCLGEVLLHSPITSPPEHILLKAKETHSWSLVFEKNLCLSNFFPLAVSTLNKMVKTLATGSSKSLKVAEFLGKFRKFSCNFDCGFFSVLCFHHGEVYFYITHLRLFCEDHFRLFSDFVVPSNSVHSASGPLCLKFLKTLDCLRYGTSSMEPLGAAIKVCNHVELIQVSFSNDSLCHFLEEIPNPSSCSLSIGLCTLTSAGAVKLAYLLPRFENVTDLTLSLAECSDEAVTRLFAAIKHKTLEELKLRQTKLTSAAAVALGQSLHASQALRKLDIGGFAECSDEAVTSLVAAIKHKTLEELELSEMKLTSAAAEALGQALPHLSTLRTLNVSVLGGCSLGLTFPHSSLKLPMLTISGLAECSAKTVSRLVSVIKLQTLAELLLSEFNLTSSAAEALGHLLPELSAVRALNLFGLNQISAEAVTSLVSAIKHKTIKEMELVGINLTSAAAEALSHSLPKFSTLQTLTISNFNQCFNDAFAKVVAAIKHKTLKELTLTGLHLTPAAATALGHSLPELSALERLVISGLTLCSPEAVTSLVAAIKQKTLKELILTTINLTSEVASALGQSLPELSALQTLEISGSYGCRLQHTEMKAMFGRFDKPSLLQVLKISRFSARGSLTALTKNLCFFPRLKQLHLEVLDLGEADFIDLLENLKFIPDLYILILRGNPLGHAVRLMVPYSPTMEKLELFALRQGDCSDEDLNFVREAVKGKLPQLRIDAWS